MGLTLGCMFRRNILRHGGNSPKLMVSYYVWRRLCTRKRFYRRLLFLLHYFSVSKRLPLVYCSLIYLVAFPSFLLPCSTLYRSVFFIFPSFIYIVCASICLQNSHNGCCLGHLHAFIFFCLLLPFLLISLPLSSVVIFRVLGFKWARRFISMHFKNNTKDVWAQLSRVELCLKFAGTYFLSHWKQSWKVRNIYIPKKQGHVATGSFL